MFLNNRYHDPTLGTFISVDPLVSITAQPYLYAGGNPTTYSDPTGLCSMRYDGLICADQFRNRAGGGGGASAPSGGTNDRTAGPPAPSSAPDSGGCSLPRTLLCPNSVPRFPGDGSGLDIFDGELNGIYQYVIIGTGDRSELYLTEQWQLLVDLAGFGFSGGDATRYTTFEDGTIYLVYNGRVGSSETEPCPWPFQSPRWWPGKVLAVVSR